MQSSIHAPIVYSIRPCIVPAKYDCSKCKATNCKLWREYQVSANRTDLFCASCGLTDQKKEGSIDADGYRSGERTDTIGWLVPAVPVDDGSSYWGYSNVPIDGVQWWRALNTYP